MLTPSALMWTQIGAGVFGLLVGTQSYGIWRARGLTAAGRNWLSVPGEILESGVERHGISGDQYSAVVRYRYRVGTKDYVADAIRADGRGVVSRASAEALAEKYAAGRRLRVYYNPRRPARAVLEPGKSANIAIMIVVLILFVVVESTLVSLLLNDGKLPATPGGMPWVMYLMPAFLFFFGGACFVQYVQTRRLARVSERWPMVAGTITTSSVATEMHEDKKGDEYEVYRTDIRYSYRVGASDYRGTRVGWGWGTYYASKESAAAAAAKYPAGARVAIHYDPLDPERAVLDPAARRGRAGGLMAGSFLAGIGGVFLWFMILIG